MGARGAVRLGLASFDKLRTNGDAPVLRQTQDERIPICSNYTTPFGLSLSKPAFPSTGSRRTERFVACCGMLNGPNLENGIHHAAIKSTSGRIRFFSPQEIVELTMTAGFYINGTLVTRALGVKPTPLAPERTYGQC